ncbi:epimerase [Microbacterium gorillae]|uniref:epimerase n=1 Tax=Microbacterium gorillae TaxID=1231063 RepID=UPI00058DBAE2|nr:DUF1731 domain-containing protein [Microbacterium gorillae]
MTARSGRVVIGGASGLIGSFLVPRYRAAGREVVTIGRGRADLHWDDAAGIARAVDGADLVIGLAGKSVSCRYTPANRAEILRSRIETTAALADAIAAADAPPPVWLNSSTATIYRHAMDRPQTESTGELGTGFSVDIARAWERALFARDLPGTRRVALRTAIVLGSGGGVLPMLQRLARVGLGGANHDGWWPSPRGRVAAGTAHRPGSRRGEQHLSWVRIEDVARAIDFLEEHDDPSGPVNIATPTPSVNHEFMRLVRRGVGARVGVPMPRWMSELGAIMLRTETELVLKSRWVLPERLEAAGFRFAHTDLATAVRPM